MILKGKKAKSILAYLLKNFDGENNYIDFPYTGYYKVNNIYCCFDNSHYCCYVEETKSKIKAILWCKGEIDTNKL